MHRLFEDQIVYIINHAEDRMLFLDLTFVPDAITRFGTNATIRALGVYTNSTNAGKVILGGAFDTVGGLPRTNLARLNPDGTVDRSFNPGRGPDNAVYSVIVQTDGKVLIGGDFQGKNPEIPNALRTYIGPGVTIRADATQKGDGGKVVVWADGDTRFAGTITFIADTVNPKTRRITVRSTVPNPDGRLVLASG